MQPLIGILYIMMTAYAAAYWATSGKIVAIDMVGGNYRKDRGSIFESPIFGS